MSHDPQADPRVGLTEEDPIGDLLAFGQAESTMALKAKDRDSYQFWQGWNSALERVARLRVALRAPQPQEAGKLIEKWRKWGWGKETSVRGDATARAKNECADDLELLIAASAVGDPPEGTQNPESCDLCGTRGRCEHYNEPEEARND